MSRSHPSSSTAPHRTLDADALAALDGMAARLGDDGFFDGIVERFLRDASMRIAEMRAALSDGDASRLELQAHTLKSSAGYLGATRMVELSVRLEAAARGGHCAQPQTGALLAELEQERQRLEPCLRAFLAARPRAPAD